MAQRQPVAERGPGREQPLEHGQHHVRVRRAGERVPIIGRGVVVRAALGHQIPGVDKRAVEPRVEILHAKCSLGCTFVLLQQHARPNFQGVPFRFAMKEFIHFHDTVIHKNV